jgi:hypothetical protein
MPRQLKPKMQDEANVNVVPEELSGRLRWKRHQNRQPVRHRHGTQSKLDRRSCRLLDGRISEAFWTRKSQEWESELATIKAELSRLTITLVRQEPCIDRSQVKRKPAHAIVSMAV